MTDVAERLRIELLENLDSESSLDRIRQIISTPSQLDRRVALKILVKDVSRAVVNVFRGHVSIRVGRPTEPQERSDFVVAEEFAHVALGDYTPERSVVGFEEVKRAMSADDYRELDAEQDAAKLILEWGYKLVASGKT